MTKEIINGIDVSECYADKKMMKDGLYCFWEGGSCADNKFCYFKEYKRLQKENEKLKADLKGETEQCQKWYQLETDKHFQMLKYKQALEEIRNIAKPIKENTCFGMYCGAIDWILNEINEVLK